MNERGSASFYVVALLMVLVSVTSGLAGVGGLVVAHRRAQAAADLAALAGAAAAARDDGCASAAAIAVANGARLTSCRSAGGQVWLTVRVTSPGFGGFAAAPEARAHAGP